MGEYLGLEPLVIARFYLGEITSLNETKCLHEIEVSIHIYLSLKVCLLIFNQIKRRETKKSYRHSNGKCLDCDLELEKESVNLREARSWSSLIKPSAESSACAGNYLLNYHKENCEQLAKPITLSTKWKTSGTYWYWKS